MEKNKIKIFFILFLDSCLSMFAALLLLPIVQEQVLDRERLHKAYVRFVQIQFLIGRHRVTKWLHYVSDIFLTIHVIAKIVQVVQMINLDIKQTISWRIYL